MTDKMNKIQNMSSVIKAAREAKANGETEAPTVSLEMTAIDRSTEEGYVSLDDICGYKTGINKHFKVYETDHWEPIVQGLIPASDPNIKLDKDYALAICMAIETGSSLLAYGPPGTGKSVTPREVCARLNYPFLYIQGMGGTEPADFVGSPWLSKENGMEWRDAIGSFAVRYGTFLLFDEPFKTSAQTNMCFQSLLDDRRELKLYGHPNPIEATLKAHPNFRIALADNVRGVGDSMGKYAAEIQDQSTMDRMDIVIEVGYPSQKDEVQIMRKKFPDVEEVLINKMVMTANLIRRAWAKDDVALPFTMRKTQNWIKHTREIGDIAQAFRFAYLNSCTSDEEIKAVKKAYNTVKFGTDI